LSGTGAFAQAPSARTRSPDRINRRFAIGASPETGRGSTAGVEIGRERNLAIDRCGVNTCDGRIAVKNLMDLATGRPTKSIGEGLFVSARAARRSRREYL
jgi:hypothetical protein